MLASLKQEQLRRHLVKVRLDGSSSNSGSQPKEEEDNVALASQRRQGQQRQKKYISKVKCFRCGEMGNYASQCPFKKKDKDEKNNFKVANVKIK